MRKVLGIIFAIVFVLSNTSVISAAAITDTSSSVETASIYMDAEGKLSFVEKVDKRTNEALANGEIITDNRETVSDLIRDVTFATDSEKGELEKELETYGVYIYNSELDTEAIQPRSGSGDVTLQTPIVAYDSILKQFIVTCGGHWNNYNWLHDGVFASYGGPDAFGVGYTQTGRPYASSVVGASAYITDQKFEYTVSTQNRSDGDGSKGFGFRLQDYLYHTAHDEFLYIGYKWYGSCTYDLEFARYNGIATAYYVHTWNSTAITDITFGYSDKAAGIQVTLSVVSDSFTAYSSDKRFGVA